MLGITVVLHGCCCALAATFCVLLSYFMAQKHMVWTMLQHCWFHAFLLLGFTQDRLTEAILWLVYSLS